MITPQQLSDDKQGLTPVEAASFLDQAIDLFIIGKDETERMSLFNALNNVGIHVNYEVNSAGVCGRKKAPRPH